MVPMVRVPSGVSGLSSSMGGVERMVAVPTAVSLANDRMNVLRPTSRSYRSLGVRVRLGLGYELVGLT